MISNNIIYFSSNIYENYSKKVFKLNKITALFLIIISGLLLAAGIYFHYRATALKRNKLPKDVVNRVAQMTQKTFPPFPLQSTKEVCKDKDKDNDPAATCAKETRNEEKEKVDGKNPFVEIPNALLSLILNYVDDKSYLKLGRTTKVFYTIVSKDPKFHTLKRLGIVLANQLKDNRGSWQDVIADLDRPFKHKSVQLVALAELFNFKMSRDFF